MRSEQIQVGFVYAVKVSGTVVPVRVYGTRASRDPIRRGGGQKYHGKNLATGRELGTLSARRIRHQLVEVDGRWVPVSNGGRS